METVNMNDGARADILSPFLPPIEEAVTAIRWQFASVAEARALALSYVARPDGPHLAGGDTPFRDLIAMVDRPASALAKAAALVRDRISASAPLAPRLRGYAVHGAHPSVPRFLAGLPDCMHSRAMVGAPRIISLALNVTSGMTAAHLAAIAGAVAAIVEQIEASGTRVRLIVTNRSYAHALSGGKAVCDVAVVAKEPDQPVDLARVAMWCGNEPSYRGVLWAIKLGDASARKKGARLGDFHGDGWASDAARNVFVLPRLFLADAAGDPVSFAREACADLTAQGLPVSFSA